MNAEQAQAKFDVFAVVAAEPASWDPGLAAKALAATLKTPAADQIARAKRAWGILRENMERGAADDFALDLSQNGLASLVFPQGLIPKPPPPMLVKSLLLEDSGLRATAAGAVLELLAWKNIAVLSAAALPQTVTKTITSTPEINLGKEALKLGLTLATGIPLMGRGKKEETKTVSSSDFSLTLDIATPDVRLRVAADHFDYSGLGPLKTHSSAANFKILLSEIAKRANSAIVGRGARLMLDSKPLRGIGHESADDIDLECRWLLALAARRRGA